MQEIRCATVEKMEDLMPLIRESLDQGNSVRFSPRGRSMLPMLRQGIDSVVISPRSGPFKKYDLPLYRRDDGKYILHRIVDVADTYTCLGDHQFTKELGVRNDQVIALVTGFYRGEEYHSVNETGYRLYCRLWHYSRPIRYIWHRGSGWLRRKIK